MVDNVQAEINPDSSADRIFHRDAEISEALQHSDLHPLLKRIYANRGVTNPGEVEYELNNLLDYHLLKGIDTAASIVADAIESGKKILIVGDFDADGATSSAVVMRCLRAFGHQQADYLVPNRFDFGYGLSPQIVDVAVEQCGHPGLIITVDNGISSIEGVARANEHGIEVVVTDHHLAGDQLPNAAAIVNPNQPGCDFPEKSIAGVGVAFYLMLAVRAQLRERNWFDSQRNEPNMAAFLDLVALGTVADVVPLEKNNRILVAAGLQRIRQNRASAGILALLNVAGKSPERCTAQEFGFAIGPRLNAAGRLEDMSVGIECLLSDDAGQAGRYASMLNEMNTRRRDIESEMLAQAMKSIDQLYPADAGNHTMAPAIALYNQQWHQGVVGLVASRIKERFHRPVIAFAPGSDVEPTAKDAHRELKGSARSIPGVHIRDVLDAIDRKYSVIEKFGGHAMAAGLTIREENFETFEQAFIAEVESVLDEDMLSPWTYTDGSVEDDLLTMEFSDLLRFSGPWGQHFPEPLFDGIFSVTSWRIVGDKHLKLELVRQSSGLCVDAIAFNMTDADLPAGDDRIHIAYRMDVNEFRGNRRLQLIVEKILPVGTDVSTD
jgi:single-stranded-DNA-specific exonuclease